MRTDPHAQLGQLLFGGVRVVVVVQVLAQIQEATVLAVAAVQLHAVVRHEPAALVLEHPAPVPGVAIVGHRQSQRSRHAIPSFPRRRDRYPCHHLPLSAAGRSEGRAVC